MITIGTIYIRDVDESIKNELKKRAKKRGVSLNEYCKQVFKNETENAIVTEVEQRYLTIVKEVTMAISKISTRIDELTIRLEDWESRQESIK